VSTTAWIVIVVAIVVIVAIAVAVWMSSQQKRSRGLKDRFGPEYERTVDRVGDKGRAETMLAKRQERVEKLHIRELAPDERGRFADAWRSAQAHFVDAPGAAVNDAEELVTRVMQTRGYPVDDFEQRAADVSVDHPAVVSNYRSARQIAQKNQRGEATTEDLRQAMVHYRSLFDDLLGKQETARTEARR
jgi:FtsZ-interacting cell division protein ZipA